MTDQELIDIRKSIPKYLNDMTEDQAKISAEAYAEQKRRYDEKRKHDFSVYNREVEKAG